MADHLLLGDFAYSCQLQATHVAVTHVVGGSMCLLGTITCQVSVGPVTTTECIYIAEGVKQLYLSLKACKALCLVHYTFPCPPVCAVEPSHTPQNPLHPKSPPHELVEENVNHIERWFLEHFGRTVFAMGGTLLPEMSSPTHQIHLQPAAGPHIVLLHFFDKV